MNYFKGLSLLAVFTTITCMDPLFASGEGTMPPLNTEENAPPPPSQPVKQKKTLEEKVGTETGKGVAKLEKAAKKTKKAYKEALHKERKKQP